MDLTFQVASDGMVVICALSNDAIYWLCEEMVHFGNMVQDRNDLTRFYLRPHPNFTLEQIAAKMSEYAVPFKITEHAELFTPTERIKTLATNPVFLIGVGLGTIGMFALGKLFGKR